MKLFKSLTFFNKTKPVPIAPEFYNELIAETIRPKHYLFDEQREHHEISFVEGIGYDANGDILDGNYLFVLLPDGDKFKCYASDQNSLYRVKNHSHLAGGKPVAGAGYLTFSKGVLQEFSNESGHYKPTVEQMKNAIVYLLKKSNRKELVMEIHSRPAPGLPVQIKKEHVVNLLGIAEKPISSVLLPFSVKNVSSRFGGVPARWALSKMKLEKSKMNYNPIHCAKEKKLDINSTDPEQEGDYVKKLPEKYLEIPTKLIRKKDIDTNNNNDEKPYVDDLDLDVQISSPKKTN